MHNRIALAATLSLAISLIAYGVAGADSSVVLGSSSFEEFPGKEGWGKVRPHRIFNGGDPSGLVSEIQWTSWGGKTAIGYGLNSISRPHGGYYAPVLIELRASGLGRCHGSGARAYTHLSIRAPERPEGPLGPWRAWAEAPNIC
jgi:hypothetical protein